MTRSINDVRLDYVDVNHAITTLNELIKKETDVTKRVELHTIRDTLIKEASNLYMELYDLRASDRR